MSKVLIIGAGGVGRVVASKCADNPDVFSEIMLASRTLSKCETIAKEVGKGRIQTAQVNADNVPEVVELINRFKPELVINVALPYQDLPIMDACLETGVNYLDTANYEPKEEAKFEYSWQWAYNERFAEKGIMAVLGCGFDPGEPVSIPLMQLNIISMKSILWILLTVMQATTGKLLPQTLTRKSTSGKLPKRVNTGKMANG